MTYVEKLDQWLAQERGAGRIVDLKFFPNYLWVPGMSEPVKLFDGPEPTHEQVCEAAYKLLTGETPSQELDVTDY